MLAATPLSPRERFLTTTTVLSLLIAVAAVAHTAARPPLLQAEAATIVANPRMPPLAAFSQSGRTVIVTGSSRGIGKGIAQVFAEAGANVLITSRHLSEAQVAAEEIVAAGGIASAFAADVSVEEEVEAMIAAAIERYGGVDVMCANAGSFPSRLLEEMSVAEWDSSTPLRFETQSGSPPVALTPVHINPLRRARTLVCQ